MNRKTISALVAILVTALVGAYASSMISTGSFKLSAIETVGSFIIEADQIVISGGTPSLLLSLASASDGVTPIAFAQQVDVAITNLVLTKVEGDKKLEISADTATGYMLAMNITTLSAYSASFVDLTIVDIPEFEQSAGAVTFNYVEIHAVYMYAELQTLYGMELTVTSV